MLIVISDLRLLLSGAKLANKKKFVSPIEILVGKKSDSQPEGHNFKSSPATNKKLLWVNWSEGLALFGGRLGLHKSPPYYWMLVSFGQRCLAVQPIQFPVLPWPHLNPDRKSEATSSHSVASRPRR
jgi:hypothetical protein